MASGLSNNTDIISNENEDGSIKKIKNRNDSGGGAAKKNKKGNDCEDGFIEEIEAENSVTREMVANWVPTDQTDTIQLSSAGEDTTKSTTKESSKSSRSEHGQKFDVFLSHSGKQKNFVRQLYRDLTIQGVSCFFDQDRESLPLAEHFPSHIFEAVKTCKIAVLLLSMDFIQSKWPMLELSAFVKARDITHTNPNLKILPLFFRISLDVLKNTEENDKKWQQQEISRETTAEWHQALKTIRGNNGLRLVEGGDEVKFRDEIVKAIWDILPTPSPRYHVRGMQGEARMCQEVADFFNGVQPNKEGIRIAGLYGIAGRGKTTLGKAFCNLKLGDFKGKVCHLEFSRGNLFERIKLALQYLTHRPESVQTLTIHDQAQVEMYRRVKGQRVLLVLDNITEESIDEVLYYLKADLGENSWVLLSARSVDVLVKHFNIDSQSCMRVPRLEEEEAVAILLERAFLEKSKITAEDRAFALRCAKRCLFKGTSCDIGPRSQSFHPLALKAFGGYLFIKCGSNLSKWVDEIDDMVGGSGDGLDEVFDVLCKAFDGMLPKYRTIFMLLTVYVVPNMSLHNVIEWMAINCNEEITFIEKAVEGLQKAAFIEEFKPEIRIHELYMEFAQRKAEEMGRWLCWKGNKDTTRGLIAQDKEGFELAKLEQCMYRRIGQKHLRNLCVLQLVHVDVTSMSKLDLGPMDSLRSITLRDCKDLEALDGMEKLVDLAWLQIRGVYRKLKLPDLSSFQGLQYLEIHITGSEVFHQLGDLSHCFNLREINVDCPSLLEFPWLKGMQHLKKVEFSSCDKVKGALDCRGCVELQIIVLNHCCQMAASPLLSGCKKLSKLVLWECDAVPACPDVDAPNTLKTLELFISSEAASAPKYLDSFCLLENLQLWNMRELMELPSFKRLSNLTVLKLANCGIRELPDLTGCDRLEDVYFFTLKHLERLPNFSLLRELKMLSLCNCTSLECPPHIVGCHKLQVLHLLYNDNMKGLSKMDKCAQLEEIQVSWHSKDEVSYAGNDSDSCQVSKDLEFCLEYWKDEKFGNIDDVSLPDALKELELVKGKKMLVKRYIRGVKLYYSLTAPYCWISNEDGHSKRCTKNLITLKIIDSKVMTFPTMARDSRDRDWVHKVNGYFAATKKDKTLASASSVSSNIVKDISLEPPRRRSPRYHVPSMEGEARMCQVIADFFKTVHPNGKGIRIAGLYGMSGLGKSTLTKACCNYCYSYFHRKVCHLEFCTGGNIIERLKLVLQYLTQFRMPNLGSITKDAQLELSRRVKGQKVLLVLDNISEQNIEEVKYYLEMDFGENSCILLSTQKLHSLEKDFKIDSKSCMHVPTLLETEAIAILCERKPSEASAFSVKLENKDFSLQCAKKCSFEDDRGFVQFHPLALKAFGRYMFRKECYHFSSCAAAGSRDGSKNVFVVLNSVFHGMGYKCCNIFMLLARGTPPHMSTKHTFQWLASNCKEEIEYIMKIVAGLYDNAFIEEIEPVIRIHELWKEFAHNKDKYDRLAPQQEHHVPPMQGGARMCQELAEFFHTVRPNAKGIRIAGLYGMVGQGKTSLCKTFCNLNLSVFDGKVCYLEFCRGNELDRLKIALQYLTHCNESQLDSMTELNEVRDMFRERVKDQRALLVLDNITEYSIWEVNYYLRADLGENSYILLNGRSENVLANKFKINSESCMSVPCLEEEEAIAILLERRFLVESAMGPENRGFALHCANKCSFKKTSRDIDRTVREYHPLALKTFGRHLFFKHGADLSHWVAEADDLVFGSGDGLDDIFIVLEKAFDYMDPKNRTIFMLLALDMQPIESPLNVNEWLAITCKEEIKYIKKAVEDLQQKGFIEEIEPEIRIHDLYVEFAQSKPRWLWRNGFYL